MSQLAGGQLPCTHLDVGDPVPIAGDGSSSRLMATVLAHNNGKQTGRWTVPGNKGKELFYILVGCVLISLCIHMAPRQVVSITISLRSNTQLNKT